MKGLFAFHLFFSPLAYRWSENANRQPRAVVADQGLRHGFCEGVGIRPLTQNSTEKIELVVIKNGNKKIFFSLMSMLSKKLFML